MTMLQEPSPVTTQYYEDGELLHASPEAETKLPDITFVSPLLSTLHGKVHGGLVAEFHAPPNVGLPTEMVRLESYYNNMQDHDLTGTWKIHQVNHPPVYVRSGLRYGEEDPALKDKPFISLSQSMKPVEDPFSPDRLDLDREAQVVELLRLATNEYNKNKTQQDQTGEHAERRHRFLGGLFLPHRRKQSE